MDIFDVCASNPCLNGNCVAPLPGIFRCNCDQGFIGTYCQEKLILCDSVLCLNGGYCINNTDSTDLFKCECAKVSNLINLTYLLNTLYLF